MFIIKIFMVILFLAIGIASIVMYVENCEKYKDNVRYMGSNEASTIKKPSKFMIVLAAV